MRRRLLHRHLFISTSTAQSSASIPSISWPVLTQAFETELYYIVASKMCLLGYQASREGYIIVGLTALCKCCRRPAIDDITGQAMTWTSGPAHASVDGLSSSAIWGEDMQLWNTSTAFRQVDMLDACRMQRPFQIVYGQHSNLLVSTMVVHLAKLHPS